MYPKVEGKSIVYPTHNRGGGFVLTDSAVLKTVSISSSSKNSGKSTVASFLVGELGADYGLKVSHGNHAPAPIVTEPEIISRPGTDTAALVRAGAKKVVWVNADAGTLENALEQALALFSEGGVLVAEGNSALERLSPDFAVFLMTAPFEEFKPSASPALEKANLVLVDLRWALADTSKKVISAGLHARAPNARTIFYSDKQGFTEALEETARLARKKVAL
ncbi:MAG: hypothetical protein CVT63_01115 [Candidatus Anoxymicrobium japonicum]|uniref:Uncharacterized protein n=1 Tax=Candidatus Anoxymicrobium japonicum TaxID=2013648 RepID=A0A2N3G7N4_9ACTN|nr:MAG: hypothetical protein CVT63_01115 [Candidatus Anoxymicrobium japonicum]